MCLSTVFVLGEGEPEEICSHLSNATVENDEITFVDIMGAQTKVKGTIDSVDLVENKIFVAAAK